MEYKQVVITEELDVLELTDQEYEAVNKLYYDIISKRNPGLAKTNQIGDVKRCILTDGLSRLDLTIKHIS